jgi:serine/threonine protein kinase
MTPERYARIKEIFGAALELRDSDRIDYLKQNCGTDADLRAEVEQLLEAEREPLENPVIATLARAPSGFSRLVPAELNKGEMLAHYRVESKIGQGGMGVVYKAWDIRLDRRIALKVLRPDQVNDPVHRQRLVREARAASSLVHPNIVTVHDVGSDREIDYIAMEHVEGRPLDQLIPREGLAPKQALAYAIQIAAALAGAHASTVVHRDLKPGNIMITREGLVKLLDFGLAQKRARQSDPAATVTIHHQQIAGTPQYMSPEQIRGDVVDHRSDIFACGLVLCRMLTGRDLFDRGTPIETMNAVLNADHVELLAPCPAIPQSVASVILHCLEKEPADRFQSAHDLQFALEACAASLGPLPLAAEVSPLRRYALWVAALVLCSALSAAAVYSFFGGHRHHPSVDGMIFAQITNDAGAELFPSLSNDGSTVVYASKSAGNWNIYLHRAGTPEAVNLTKDSEADDTQPAFSPDGSSVAFRSERSGGGIFVMRSDGSHVRRVSDAGYNPAWSPDGRQLVYAEESIARPEDRSGRVSRLWTVELATGKRQLLNKEDGVQPNWSPNGQFIAYWAIDLDGDRDLWTVRSTGGPPIRITRDHFLDWNPVWSPDGSWLYFCSNRGGSMGIWRIAMKESTGEAHGAPEPIHTPASYPAHLAFSRNGRYMAYVQQITTGRIAAVRFDPTREAVVSEPKEILQSTKGIARPALSPDGDWLAFNSTEQQEELFVMNVDGSGLRQITSGGFLNRGPRWSPDGKHLAFFSKRTGDWEIWASDANGNDLRQLTNLSGYNVAWPVWSADNKHVAYTIFGLNTFLIDSTKGWDVQSPEKLPPFPGEGELFNGWNWSPDGATVAGFLNRENGLALYNVQTRTYRKLTKTGADPVWLSDSRRLLYLDRGKIYLIDSVTGATRELVSATPEEIARRGFAIAPDDRHIYFSIATTEADVWMLEFEK